MGDMGEDVWYDHTMEKGLSNCQAKHDTSYLGIFEETPEWELPV